MVTNDWDSVRLKLGTRQLQPILSDNFRHNYIIFSTPSHCQGILRKGHLIFPDKIGMFHL